MENPFIDPDYARNLGQLRERVYLRQCPPAEPWREWLMVGGAGYGKTFAHVQYAIASDAVTIGVIAAHPMRADDIAKEIRRGREVQGRRIFSMREDFWPSSEFGGGTFDILLLDSVDCVAFPDRVYERARINVNLGRIGKLLINADRDHLHRRAYKAGWQRWGGPEVPRG